MGRPVFRQLRRCRVLFALALCAWLGLAATAFARVDCCAGLAGLAAHAHGHGMPAHADSGHADCACAHMAATLPVLAATPGLAPRAAKLRWTWSAAASDPADSPPLRPPLA